MPRKAVKGANSGGPPQMLATLEENGNIEVEYANFSKFVPRVRERLIVAMEHKWSELQAAAVHERRVEEREKDEEERRKQKMVDRIGPRALTDEEAALLVGKEA